MQNTRKPPTMADIARITGVSPMTVSRAFRNDGSVSEETLRSIMRVSDDLGYVFDSTASNLRSQKTDFVAVTIPSINNANFADTVRGISEGLERRGLQILLGNTKYDIAEEERLVGQLLRRRPQAIVVTGGQHTPRTRKLLANAGIPVVETWDIPEEPIGHVVGFSNVEAGRLMVEHLAKAGYERIAFLGGERESDRRGMDRRKGFLATMAQYGLDASRLVDAGAPPVSMREGAKAMAQLLDCWPDTRAVVCVSDLVAFGALSECQRRGISVPDTMAICGFGDYEIGAVCVPDLTTVNVFARAIGEKAAQLVLDVLDGAPLSPRTRITITPELVVRHSTTAARGGS